MKSYLSIALLSATLAGFSITEAAAETAASTTSAVSLQKVVYHINYNDLKLVNAALGNIQNHINAVGAENLDLRVALHGNGVEFLKTAKDDIDLQAKVGSLRSQNVRFLICRNTLTARNISLDDLFEVNEDDIVLSGVAEAARLQHLGYAYIKP
jgi:uncharacterized protein